MDIDVLINFIETSQKTQMEMRRKYKNVEAGEPFTVFDILQKISDKNKLSSKVAYLNNRITYLALIVRRLRKAIDSAHKTLQLETMRLRYIEIDIEAFFHISYSLLNLLARLTPEFFEKPIKGLKSGSFYEQRKWFIKEENIRIDPDYSEYLTNKTEWFEEFHCHRKQLAHYHPLLTFRSVPELELFFDTGERRGTEPNINVRDYINKTANGIINFVAFYNLHFGRNSLREKGK